jgi:hypothetical protein
MRRLILILGILSLTSALYAQPTPIGLPPIYTGISSSVVDSGGNVLILNGSYALTGIPVSVKTHVTVISSDGKTKSGYYYDGSYQVIGVGRNAIYAIVTSYATVTGTPVPAISQHLVAMRVVAGTLPLTLPMPPNDLPSGNVDVKLSPGSGPGATDTIAVIAPPIAPPIPTPAGTGPTTGTGTTTLKVWLYTSDGITFTANANNPIGS